jgi:hypothetical protein
MAQLSAAGRSLLKIDLIVKVDEAKKTDFADKVYQSSEGRHTDEVLL